MPKHSLRVQVAEVERELRMRREVYPRQVHKKKMRAGEAQELISIMESVHETLTELQQQQQVASGDTPTG